MVLKVFSKYCVESFEYESFKGARSKPNVNQIEERSYNSSTRKVERDIAIPKSTIHRVMKSSGCHPYKPVIVQKY